MKKTRQSWVNRSLAIILAISILFGIGAINLSTISAGQKTQTITAKYTVPIKSLTTTAPLKPVKDAFNKAFGDSITVVVNADGTKTAYIKNHHMVIFMFGSDNHANVSSIVDANTAIEGIQDATIISTKEELATNGIGGDTQAITVPDEFTIPLNLDENNSQSLSITVDFIDAFLGGGNPYPTTVKLNLDMDNIKFDVSQLEILIKECESIAKENYTEESVKELENVIEKAKQVLVNPQSVENINSMMSELKSAKDALKYKGADYGAVDRAIAKIPLDSTIYTEESWAVLQQAKNSVVNGLDASQQEIVNGFALEIERAISALVLKDADYSVVEKAIASVPKDMSQYTDESVKKVNDAIESVEYGLKADKQSKVNSMANAISRAVLSLQKKNVSSLENQNNQTQQTNQDEKNNTYEKIDINNLKDGVYELPVALWHATKDTLSMASSSFNSTARVVVTNGKMRVYTYTKPMTFGNITASLQEMKVQQSNGNFVNAIVETKSNDGNPTCFSFPLDKLNKFVSVKVNPRVEIMGNQDLDARLKFNVDAIKIISKKTDKKPTTPPANVSSTNNKDSSNIAKTSDNFNADLCFALVFVLISGVITLSVVFKRVTTSNK